jgi:hypothetical protein
MGLFTTAAQKNHQNRPFFTYSLFTSRIPSRIIDIVRTRSGERNSRKMFWSFDGRIKGDLWQRKE